MRILENCEVRRIIYKYCWVCFQGCYKWVTIFGSETTLYISVIFLTKPVLTCDIRHI